MDFIYNPLYVIAFLCLNIILSEWLVKKTFLKHFGVALLVILVTAFVANIGLMPSASDTVPLYGIIFSHIAPISIFYLLLDVNLKNLKQAGIPMLVMFLIGSGGTFLGAIVGMWVAGGPETIGPMYSVIAGMFTGTYTGGSINFNAVALHYKVMDEGTLFAGSVAVDNVVTTLWMVLTIAIPKLLHKYYPRKKQEIATGEATGNHEGYEEEKVSPQDLAILLVLGPAVLLISNYAAGWLGSLLGFQIPSILILTTIALIMAQSERINRLRGKQVLGLFTVYLFLAVIGAYSELATLAQIGTLAFSLLLFAGILAIVHGAVCFGLGALMKQDWDLIAIASQANIGGSTSALALAKSFNRNDLLLPAILVGSLGNGIGTYLGFLVAGIL